MKSIESKVESDLQSHYYDNRIYFMSEEEKDKYEKIKELLKKDYGFLDIVLEFDDFNELDKIFDGIQSNDNYDNIKHRIINQYLNYKMLKNANIDEYHKTNVSDIEKDLFSGDIEKIANMDLLSPIITNTIIKTKAKDTKRGYGRVNILLDSVNDAFLQSHINDLIVYRGNVAIMGYTTKELVTYYTSSGGIIENIKDYGAEYSEEKVKEFKKRGIL
ncbi:MAG: hypothetical protein IJ565_05295 [Bacilli bacterium]|nr:hypothetical protein [Bacilli bacterium]